MLLGKGWILASVGVLWASTAAAEPCGKDGKAVHLSAAAEDAVRWRVSSGAKPQFDRVVALLSDRQWPAVYNTVLIEYLLPQALSRATHAGRLNADAFVVEMYEALDALCVAEIARPATSAPPVGDGAKKGASAVIETIERTEQMLVRQSVLAGRVLEATRTEREVAKVADAVKADAAAEKEALIADSFKLASVSANSLGAVLDAAASYLDLGQQPPACTERELSFSRCVEFGIDQAAMYYRQFVDAETKLVALDAGDARTKQIVAKRSQVDRLFARAQGLTYSNLRNYAIFSGPSYSLRADNGWKTGGEFLFRTESDAFRGFPFTRLVSDWIGDPTPIRERSNCAGFFAWCRTFAEVSYVSDSGLPGRNTTSPGDPLGEIDGVFRVNSGVQMHWNETMGMQFGVGVTAASDGSESELNADSRMFLGLHTQTPFLDGAQGQFFIGAAHDNFWDDIPRNRDRALPFVSSDDDRWVIDGQMRFPGLGIGAFKLAARLYVDAPQDRKGRSEVRTGLLFYYDFDALTKGRNPAPAAK